MAKELALVENFKGMRFLNSPQLSETEDVLKIETVPVNANAIAIFMACLLYTSPSPRDATLSRMPSSA